MPVGRSLHSRGEPGAEGASADHGPLRGPFAVASRPVPKCHGPSGPIHGLPVHLNNDAMRRSSFQLSIGGLLALVACVAVNIWLFRIGVLWGILGLNVTKHVAIAYLCEVLGVDRPAQDLPAGPSSPPPASRSS